MVLKIKEGTSCSWEIALAWALNAKNSLINVSVFSPNQLVFGENIKLPNVMNDQLSAGSPETKTIGDHLLALHAAWKAFIAAESSDKIRRALPKKTRNTCDLFFNCDNVYYKRDSDTKWRGPGKVISQDGPIVYVRHEGFLVKVDCNCLQLILSSNTNNENHLTDKPDEPVTEENICDNNETENQNNEISDNQHIVKFENNENSQIRKNDDKEQIEIIDEKDEAVNNMIAIVDPTKLKKGQYISFTSTSLIKLKL